MFIQPLYTYLGQKFLALNYSSNSVTLKRNVQEKLLISYLSEKCWFLVDWGYIVSDIIESLSNKQYKEKQEY